MAPGSYSHCLHRILHYDHSTTVDHILSIIFSTICKVYVCILAPLYFHICMANSNTFYIIILEEGLIYAALMPLYLAQPITQTIILQTVTMKTLQYSTEKYAHYSVVQNQHETLLLLLPCIYTLHIQCISAVPSYIYPCEIYTCIYSTIPSIYTSVWLVSTVRAICSIVTLHV